MIMNNDTVNTKFRDRLALRSCGEKIIIPLYKIKIYFRVNKKKVICQIIIADNTLFLFKEDKCYIYIEEGYLSRVAL